MEAQRAASTTSDTHAATTNMRNELRDAKRRVAEAELNYTMLRKTSAIKEQGYLQQIENLKQLLAVTETERDGLRQLLRNEDHGDIDDTTPKTVREASPANGLTPAPSPKLVSPAMPAAVVTLDESPAKRTITPPSSDRDAKRLQEKKPEAVACAAEIVKDVLDNHDKAEGRVAPKIKPGKTLVFGSNDPRLAKFITAHADPVAEWKMAESPRPLSPDSSSSPELDDDQAAFAVCNDELPKSFKIEDIEGNSDVSTIIGGLERPIADHNDDNASTVAETASDSDPDAGFDSDDSIDQELNTLFPESSEIVRERAEQEETARVRREYPILPNVLKSSEPAAPVANGDYQEKPFFISKDPWVQAKSEAIMNAIKLNLRNFSSPATPSGAQTSRPVKEETPSSSLGTESEAPNQHLADKLTVLEPTKVKQELDMSAPAISDPSGSNVDKVPSKQFTLPPRPLPRAAPPAIRTTSGALKPTAPVFRPRLSQPVGMSFDAPPLIPQKAPVPARNTTGLEATKRMIVSGITQSKSSSPLKPKLADNVEMTTENMSNDRKSMFIPGQESPEPTSGTPKKQGHNPWANSSIPHNFTQIREVSIRNIPQETTIETILSHINFGILQKVSIDWDEREVQILFVEPEAARNAYTYFHQHGLWLESKKGGLDVGPDGQVHCHLNAFLWSNNSLPLGFELRKAVFVKNMTRILLLSQLPREKRNAHVLGKDIMEGFPNIKSRDVFEKITIVGRKAEIRFTSLERIIQGVKTILKNKGYQGLKMEYGPDPCGHLVGRPPRVLNPAFKKFRIGEDDEVSSDSDESDDGASEVTEDLINLSKKRQAPEPDPKAPRPIAPQNPTPAAAVTYRDVLAGGKQVEETQFVFGKLENMKQAAAATVKAPTSAHAGSDWAQNERFASKAYQETVKRVDDNSSAVSPTSQQDETNAKVAERKKKRDQETAVSRAVHVTGLPQDITLKEFMLFVRGGAVDTVAIYPERGEALIIFVYPVSATIYRQHLINNRICIGTHQLHADNNLPRLSEMRLWTPEKVERHGASRCLFIGGIPYGTTAESLTKDLKRPAKSELVIESLMVQDVRAWIWFPSISVAHWAMKEIRKTEQYTGARVEFMRDRCEAPITEVVSRGRLSNGA